MAQKNEKNKLNEWRKKLKIAVAFPYLLLAFGITGLAASIAISVEKNDLLKHPKAVLVCDLNPVYSCSNVITSKQSTTLGISNEVFGLIMFTAVITVAVSVLAGSRPKRWFWRAFMGGMAFFSLSVVYLWYQSVYNIGSLCVLCSSVWFSGWAITAALFTWTYDQKVFAKSPKSLEIVLQYVRRNNLAFWAGCVLVLASLTLKHFWYYYGPHLGF